MEIGKIQTLEVIKEKEFGIYLAEPGKGKTGREDSVLLPRKQVPEGTRPGDRLEVFLYKDSEDRLIATTHTPLVTVGKTAVLEVKEISKIGAFLDMGLEKDLLLPFREQTHPLEKGEKCLAALYVDKSGRLAATMKVYPYLSCESPYHTGDEASGIVFEIKPDMGAFVAVDSRYHGMIPKRELFVGLRLGETVHVRVTRVRQDGKLELSTRDKAYHQIYLDAHEVLEGIRRHGGCLPFNVKAAPEVIAKEFALSKNAFKRAVGHLLKEGKVKITEQSIILLSDGKEKNASGRRQGE